MLALAGGENWSLEYVLIESFRSQIFRQNSINLAAWLIFVGRGLPRLLSY